MPKKKKGRKKSIQNNSSEGCISILTPTYNRSRFLKLIIYNIKNQIYDHSKLEWFVYDDGPEPFFTDETLLESKKYLHPIKIKYHYDKNKQSIGYKRNFLVKHATYKIVAMMDDDDIYFSNYISTSYDLLKTKKVGLVGSPEMLFIYPKLNFVITTLKCKAERQIHEATMVFTKKYYASMPGFEGSSRGEGAKMIDYNENNVAMTSVSDCMICVAHNNNTINKDDFSKTRTKLKIHNKEYIDILNSILGDQVNTSPLPEDINKSKID